MSKGIFTAGGHQLPTEPNVTDDVKQWVKLIDEFRRMGYSCEDVKNIVDAHHVLTAKPNEGGSDVVAE